MEEVRKRTLGLRYRGPSARKITNHCKHDATKTGKNPQGPRLFVQVGRDIDGHKVTLHGYVGGYLTTIVRGLTEDEANERAETEAAERGLAVRNG